MRRFSWVLIVMACACAGKKGIKQASVLDTPEGAYNQGMDYLASGRLEEAQAMFTRSRDLATGRSTEFAPAYEGLGLVSLMGGDLRTAESHMKKALDIDAHYAMARVGLARVYDARGDQEKAVEELDRALKTKTKEGQPQPQAWRWAWFYRGSVLEKMERPDEAEESYARALEVDPSFLEASRAWERLQQARRASSGRSEVMRVVARSPALTRAELAALLVETLPLHRISSPTSPARLPTDLGTSWARGYAEKAITYGLMDVAPDGSFMPEEKVTRAELALTLQRIMASVTRDPSLETKFFGETKGDFTDLSPQSPFYNAARLMTSRGIMKARQDGSFGAMEVVPGAEALEILRQFEAALR